MKKILALGFVLMASCTQHGSKTPLRTDMQSDVVESTARGSHPVTIEDASRALLAWNAVNEPDAPLARTEILPYDAASGIFVALYDWEPHWWGSVCILDLSHREAPTISELADLTEQSMLGLGILQLRGHTQPVIEILGKTHMGNGSLYLYDVVNGVPRRLLVTCAVDFHEDWAVLENGVLKRTYRDIDGDGRDDVVLEGTALQAEKLAQTDDEGGQYFIQGTKRAGRDFVRKAFRFDAGAEQFVELREWRIGPPRYMD